MDNLCMMTRPAERPYEVWRNKNGCTWLVLKKYQPPDMDKKDPIARWYCKVITPGVPEGELTDVYVRDVLELGAVKTMCDYG